MNNEIYIEKVPINDGNVQSMFYNVMVKTADVEFVPALVATCTSEAEARAVVWGVEQGIKIARQAIPIVRYDARIREAVGA